MDPDEKDSEGKAFAARTVFIVGPEKQLKLALLYPSSTGRNFGEVSEGCAVAYLKLAGITLAETYGWRKGAVQHKEARVCVGLHRRRLQCRMA